MIGRSDLRAGRSRRPGRTSVATLGEADRWEQVTLLAWGLLIAGCFGAGAVLYGLGVLTIDHLPPLHGHFRVPSATLLHLLPAMIFGIIAVRVLPGLVRRSGFGRASLVAYGFAVAWTVLLAVSADGLAAPFTHREEYLAVLPTVGDHPLSWLATFTERLPEYPTHVRGHPPLPVLVVWALAEMGLPGPLWAAIAVLLTGCSATVAIGLTVRRLAGEDAARRALPYLALTPASVWIATTMDAFFAGVAAWGIALLVLGRGRASTVWSAVAAGVLLGALPYLSYGLVPFLLIPVIVAVLVRLPRSAVLGAVAGIFAVTAAFVAGGFYWPAGVAATHAEWAAGAGSTRPYLYFLIANLAVLCLLTGPATAVGLVRAARERAFGRGDAVAAAAALVAVLALDVSGVTRGEVERIWVPFALWIGVTAAFAPGRRMLAAQVVTGLLLQGLVASPW